MVWVRSAIGATLFVALLQGCASDPGQVIRNLFSPGKGVNAYKTGLKQYENGDYVDSMKSLQSALEQGLKDGERIDAHKHLAFIHCASARERQCRDEFRRGLAIDPGMDLTAAEAGHPVWGPIFRSLKAGR